jgi:hypothetical protein
LGELAIASSSGLVEQAAAGVAGVCVSARAVAPAPPSTNANAHAHTSGNPKTNATGRGMARMVQAIFEKAQDARQPLGLVFAARVAVSLVAGEHHRLPGSSSRCARTQRRASG